MHATKRRVSLRALPRPAKWLGGIAVAYLLAVVLSALLVPWGIQRQVASRARENLHREATLAKARFNPFRLKATLIGFDLRDLDGSPLLAFDTMVVNLALKSIVTRSLALDEFRVVRPSAMVRMLADGRLAVADLWQKTDSTPEPAEPSGAPRLQVAHLGIASGEVTYRDESRTPAYEERFSELGLSVDGLSTLPNRTGDHVLTANFASGAQLRWSGSNTVDPVALDGEVVVTGVLLPRASEILGGEHPLQLVRGRGEATVRYAVRHVAGQGLQFTIPAASVGATDLAVRPRDLESDWARLARLEVHGIEVAYPARTLHVARVRLHEPWIRASRTQSGALDWQPYVNELRRPTDDGVDTVPRPPTPGWQMRIDTVEVNGGAVELSDEMVRPTGTFNVSNIRVRLAPVTNDPKVAIGIVMSAAMSKAASASLSGSMTQEPYAGDFDVELKDLDLELGEPYLETGVPVKLASGTMSLGGRVKVRRSRPNTVFDGRASVANVLVQDSAGDSLIAWRHLRATGVHVTATPNLVRIKRIAVERPFARIAISRDRVINLTTLMPPVDSTAPDTLLNPYEIQEVAFTNGEIDFSDESLILPFRTRIDSTWGSIRDVANFGGTVGTVQMEGKIEDYGLARANGTIRVNDPFATTDIRADFRNVEMSSLTPYSAQFAGYSIMRGKLDVDLDYHIKDRQLKADHKIVATDLTLGEKVDGGGQPGFLVKLAISLLKDDEGRIKFDVPVEGSVDSPEWSYSAVMWQAVQQILGKIATAPFKFLGRLFGGADDVELVDFDPGRSDVIPPEREKLDSLAAEMGRKPDLILSVEGRYDSISDVAALREASLQKLIAMRRDSLGTKAQDDTSTTMLATILESLYDGQFGKPARDSLDVGMKEAWRNDTARTSKKYDPTPYYQTIRDKLLAAQPVAPGQLEDLGRARSLAVISAITSRGIVDSTRVAVTDPVPVKRKKAGSSRIASEMKLDAR